MSLFFQTRHTPLFEHAALFKVCDGNKSRTFKLGVPFDTVLAGWRVILLTAYCLACHFAVPVHSPLSLKSCGGSQILIAIIFKLISYVLSIVVRCDLQIKNKFKKK